jgi:hypothetical protein
MEYIMKKLMVAAVADFWQKIGQMSKADALVQLERFFYKGLEHNGSKRLNIAVGDMPKKETSTSSSLFCKSIFIKSLVFELMLNVFSKLSRS